MAETITLRTIIQDALDYIGANKVGYEDLSGDETLRNERIAQSIVSRDRLDWPYVTRETIAYADMDTIDFEDVQNVSVIIANNTYLPLTMLTEDQYQQKRIVNVLDGLPECAYFQSPSIIYTFPLGTSYSFEVVGRKNLLSSVGLGSDLSNIPLFMTWYWTLSLAEALCPFYEKQWDAKRTKALADSKRQMKRNTTHTNKVNRRNITSRVRRMRPIYETRT